MLLMSRVLRLCVFLLAVALCCEKVAAQATGTSPTTTVLALCIGPAPTCPTNGVVIPPYVASLTMYFGQTFNGTVTASANDNSALDPTGSIAFQDSFNGAAPVTLCTLSVQFGSACPPAVGTTVGTAVGLHVFTGVFSGDSTHAISTSPSVTIRVDPDPTSAAVTSSLDPSRVGQSVTFTATLTGNYAAPTGPVVFLEGATQIGSASLSAGSGVTSTATFTTSTLAVGSHAITASYAATASFLATVSPVLTQVVSPVTPTTSQLVSSVNPSSAGQAVTFTDTVSVAGGAGPVPTGTVTFTDGGTAIGTAALNGSGVATFTTSALAAGSHTITATAIGDAATGPSSASLVQVVSALPPPGSVNYSIRVTPNPVSLGAGSTAAVTVTVTSLTGYTEPVTLSCSNLAYEMTCAFATATIPAGGGSTVMVLSAMAPHSCGTNSPYFVAESGRGGPLGFALAAGVLGWFGVGRRRSLRLFVVAIAAAGVALGLAACGNCTDLGTRPATYTIQVAGSGAVTSEVESAPVSVQVHL